MVKAARGRNTPRAAAPRAPKVQGKMAGKAKAGETALPRKGKGRVIQPEEDTDAPEEVSSNRRAAAELPDVPEAKRKRKRQRQRLDDDVLAAIAEGGGAVNDATTGGEGDAGAIVVAAPRASKSYRGKRILLGGDTRDEKMADGGIKVKKLRSKPVLKGREAPAEVKTFLQDHFFGDRLRRTTGPANRRRGMRAARVFVTK